MNRTIKFRAKTTANGHWVYGNLIVRGKDHVSILNKNSEPWVDPSTVGQFTGLTDRNGKEIYEGDIMTIRGRYPRVVVLDKMAWAVMPTEHYHDTLLWDFNIQHPAEGWWERVSPEFEVVGNVFDNPDLIPNQPND